MMSVIGNTDKTKTSQTIGIHKMKSQVLIAELEHLFYNGSPYDLLSGHPVGTFFTFLTDRGKILQGQFLDGRVLIQYAAYVVQLFGLRMIYFRRHQRHLFFTDFAHFVVAPFFILAVFLIGCTFTNTTI